MECRARVRPRRWSTAHLGVVRLRTGPHDALDMMGQANFALLALGMSSEVCERRQHGLPRAWEAINR
jgi:hypothetical protein